MIEVVKGDLVQALKKDEVDIAIHQVNCKGVMGAGIAKQIKSEFPRVFTQYKNFLRQMEDTGQNALGRFQYVSVNGVDDKGVVNLYSQEDYGRHGRHTNYAAFGKAIMTMADTLFKEKSEEAIVGIPYMIGCGNGGGDWEVVKTIIEDCYKSINSIGVQFKFYKL